MPPNHFNIIISACVALASSCVAAATVWAIYRSKLVELLRGERDAWKDRCSRDEMERKESDVHHTAIIKERTDKVTELRDQLQKCTEAAGVFKETIAKLEARTDFKPVMEFLQTGYHENQIIQSKTLDMLTKIAPVMERVGMLIEKWQTGTQEVHLNPLPDDAATKVQQV